jgi:hypothetical protein
MQSTHTQPLSSGNQSAFDNAGIGTTRLEVLASQLDSTVSQSLLQLEEPDVPHVKKRGRPAGRGKVNKRDKSLLEHVEKSFGKYKCGKSG